MPHKFLSQTSEYLNPALYQALYKTKYNQTLNQAFNKSTTPSTSTSLIQKPFLISPLYNQITSSLI